MSCLGYEPVERSWDEKKARFVAHIKMQAKDNDHQLKQLSVYSISGKEVHHQNFTNTIEINTQNWEKGSYIITVFSENKLIYTEKLMVQ